MDINAVRSKFTAAGLVLKDFKIITVQHLPEVCRVEGDTLLVGSSSSLSSSEGLRHVAAAVGEDAWEQLSDDNKDRWEMALVTAQTPRVMEVQAAIRSSISYQEAVEKIPSPVTRLVAINVANSLIGNGVSIQNAAGVDLESWGCTRDYARGSVPYSLLPLLGAYAPRLLVRSFPDAFSAMIVDDLKDVTHTDVRREFKDLITSLARQLESKV